MQESQHGTLWIIVSSGCKLLPSNAVGRLSRDSTTTRRDRRNRSLIKQIHAAGGCLWLAASKIWGSLRVHNTVHIMHISRCCRTQSPSARLQRLMLTSIISAVLYKRAVAIRLGFVSAQRPASIIIQFRVQERNLATEPSLWPGQSYGTVFLQQFATQTLLARSSANSKPTFFYVLRRCLILTFVMYSRSGLE